MTKYDPRKNAEGYNDPTPYAAEKHMMAQIRGKQARVAGGYFENIISASCDYYLSRGLAKIEKTPEPMKPLGAKNRKGQFLAQTRGHRGQRNGRGGGARPNERGGRAH